MTDKITLTNLVNLQNETTAVNAINSNNSTIVSAFDNTLSLNGTAPNQMQANLDMNSNHILNLPAPASNNEPLRLIDGFAAGGIQGPRGIQGIQGVQGLTGLTGPQGVAGPSTLCNLIYNAELGLTTQVSTVMVNTGVQATGFAQVGGAGSNSVQFTTSGGNLGLQPGKLVAVMGNVFLTINFTGTVTGNNTITATTPVFGQNQGDLIWITGGTNTSPRTQYWVTNTSSSTVLNVKGGLVNEGPVTYTAYIIQGSYSVDATVNGMPQAGNLSAPAFYYYPLQVTSVGTNFVNCSMAGHNLNVGTSSACKLYEVTNGSQGTGFIGPDWWGGVSTLSYYKMRQYDWSGSTVVNMPGSLYSAKLVKGSTSQELFWNYLSGQAAASGPYANYAKTNTFKGKTITYGAYLWAPNNNEGRIYIDDGVSKTYSSYVTPGSYQWVEVTKTISTSATYVHVGVSLDPGSIGDIFFYTQPIAIFGSGPIGAGNYAPRPPSLNSFVNHTNPFYYINRNISTPVYIHIEQETCGCIPTGFQSIEADLIGTNTAANVSAILADSTGIGGIPQMSALSISSPAAGVVTVGTGQVSVGQIFAGDNSGYSIDSHYFGPIGSNWSNITIDYLGAVY